MHLYALHCLCTDLCVCVVFLLEQMAKWRIRRFTPTVTSSGHPEVSGRADVVTMVDVSVLRWA